METPTDSNVIGEAVKIQNMNLKKKIANKWEFVKICQTWPREQHMQNPSFIPCAKFFVGCFVPQIFFFCESLVNESFLEKMSREQNYSPRNFL